MERIKTVYYLQNLLSVFLIYISIDLIITEYRFITIIFSKLRTDDFELIDRFLPEYFYFHFDNSPKWSLYKGITRMYIQGAFTLSNNLSLLSEKSSF